MITAAAPDEVERNQYYYLYNTIMFFVVVYMRMSYHYKQTYLYMYELWLFVGSLGVCFWYNWECTFLWAYIHSLLLFQDLFDRLDIHLPVTFLMYSTIPLVIYSICENVMIYLQNDKNIMTFISQKQQPRAVDLENTDPNAIQAPDIKTMKEHMQISRLKYVFVDLMTDEHILKFNVQIFEVYMLACSYLCVFGAGLMHTSCVADAYLLILWCVFAWTDKSKNRLRVKIRQTPSYISKASFMLYTPPTHWPVIMMLILFNICLIKEWTRGQKLKISALMVIITVVVYFDDKFLYSCPLPHSPM